MFERLLYEILAFILQHRAKKSPWGIYALLYMVYKMDELLLYIFISDLYLSDKLQRQLVRGHIYWQGTSPGQNN